jgi:methyltransferase (TIGR00027 family)
MPAEPAITADLEATARWTAAVRALERRQPDPLVDDPWAERLAGPEGIAWLAEQKAGAVLPIVLRTRYFDDWLDGATIAGTVRQVVLLGAGLDARAWRLPWRAGTTVYEVDGPDVLDAKAATMDEAVAVAACDRRAVAADLCSDWTRPLAAAGLDRNAPTAFLAEGILCYLPVAAIARVLDGVTALAAPGSRLGFDVVNHAVFESPYTRAWIEMQAAAGAPWLGWLDDPVMALAARGWSATLCQPGEPGANHGRWTLPVPPASRPDLPHNWYVTASR